LCNLYWGAFNPATFFSLREINLFSIRKGSRFELNSRRYDFLEITNLVTPPASRPYAEDGLAVNATLTEPTGGEIDGDVPTLPEWGMILLGTLLLGIGYRKQGGGGVGMPARLASLLAALLILPLLANSPAALANETLTYDPNDNRLTDGSGAKTYSPNTDRIVAENGQTFTLDAAGNITQARGYTLIWNQRAGQIKTVSQGATLLATYTYDYQGRRSRKTTTAAAPQGAGTVIYTYDRYDRLKGEFDGAGNPLRTYVWRDDVPVSIILHGTPETVLYLETDHLNTPIAARDQTGKVVWKWESDAFGTTLPNEDPDGDTQKVTINLRFPGMYADVESGLFNNHHRYYDPKLGREMSPDPIGLASGRNPFVYANNNPLSYTDPDGLQAIPLPVPPPGFPTPGSPSRPRNSDDPLNQPSSRPAAAPMPPSSTTILCLVSPVACAAIMMANQMNSGSSSSASSSSSSAECEQECDEDKRARDALCFIPDCPLAIFRKFGASCERSPWNWGEAGSNGYH